MMAAEPKTKKPKKIKKTKVEAKPAPQPEIQRRAFPAVPEGLVSVSMLPSDLATLANLMSICAKNFEEQALIAAQQNNENNYAILAARQKLSAMFATRFVEFIKMPEPESRDIH